jgi:anti-sigma regulatory factor (Ser/Thr protein kinase)
VDASSTAATLALGPSLHEIPRLKEWLKARADEHRLDAELVDRLTYCAEELFTNIVTHASAAHGAIRARLDVRGREAALTLEDDGAAFDPTKVPPPARPRSLEEAPIGGLGLHLVRQFSAGMEYERSGGTNRLVVRFGSESTR